MQMWDYNSLQNQQDANNKDVLADRALICYSFLDYKDFLQHDYKHSECGIFTEVL